jgi:hypothetical protein
VFENVNWFSNDAVEQLCTAAFVARFGGKPRSVIVGGCFRGVEDFRF